jgi:hypothetical protein
MKLLLQREINETVANAVDRLAELYSFPVSKLSREQEREIESLNYVVEEYRSYKKKIPSPIFRKLLSKIIIGLALIPSFRGASASRSGDSKTRIDRNDVFDESEVDCGPITPAKMVTGENYTGMRAGLQEQMAILAAAKNMRYRNGCLESVREFNEFVQARTKE